MAEQFCNNTETHLVQVECQKHSYDGEIRQK